MNVHVPCAVCGADDPQERYPVWDLIWDAPERWHFVGCGACGHGYLDPQPDGPALADYYEKLYTPKNLSTMISIGESGFEEKLQARRIRAIAALIGERPVRRIVDAGCGMGIFLKRLSDRFPDAQAIGIEVAGPAADRSASLPGLEIRRGLFSQVDVEPGSADVLTMNHYLEHEPDPKGALARAYEMVAPGGVIQIEIPWLGGWGRSWLGRWYWGHLPPQHLHFFSREGLSRLLTEAGFSEPAIGETRGYPLMLTTGLVLFSKFTFGSASRFRSNWLVRGPGVALGVALLPLTIAFDLIASKPLAWAGRGDILMVAARKPE